MSVQFSALLPIAEALVTDLGLHCEARYLADCAMIAESYDEAKAIMETVADAISAHVPLELDDFLALV